MPRFTNNLAIWASTRFVKIPKAIDTFPNRVGLIPLISPQMANNLKVSKINISVTVFSLLQNTTEADAS